MSDKEGNDDQDNQPPKPQRPSLPSIRSLFGITQTDNLDAVLQNESGSGGAGSSSSPYDTRRPSRTPPGARPQAPQPSSHLPLHRPSSSRPPPSAFPPGDLGASLAGPSAPRDRRRSSASSQDLPGPSRGPASAPLSSTGASPRSPPESPESLISPRHETRFGTGRGYSPIHGLATSAGGSYLPEPPESARGWHASDHQPEIGRPASASSTQESLHSPTTSSLVQRRPSTRSRPETPYTRPPSEPSKRRHTISDESGEPIPDPSPSGSSSSRPSSSRRTLHPSYSTTAPWTGTPDRHLPPLAGPSQHQPSTSGSRRSPARPSTTSHLPSLTLPGPAVSARPATSPNPYQQSHPPSSFPRRGTLTESSRPPPTPPYSSSVANLLPHPSALDTSSSRQRPYTSESSSPQDERTPSSPFVTVDPTRSATASGSSSGGAKYECPWCKKRFNRPSSLKIHVNTHTGEKPFQCPFPGCGRRFSVMSNMRRHSRVHASAEPAEDEADAEGEPEVDVDYGVLEPPSQHRPPLAALTGSSSSGPSTSTLRESSSNSRRSSLRTPSRTAVPSTHSSTTGQVQVASSSSGASGSGSGPSGSRRSIQPAPPRPLPMPLLVPAAHQSFGASAQLLLEAASSSASQQPQSPPPPPRPPARITRSASKRGRKDLDDPASDDHPSPSKRAKSNDSDRSPTRS